MFGETASLLIVVLSDGVGGGTPAPPSPLLAPSHLRLVPSGENVLDGMSLLPDADEREVIAAHTRFIGALGRRGWPQVSRKPGNGAATHTSGPPERPVWHCANGPGRERVTESRPPMTGGPANTASGDSRRRAGPGRRTTCSWPTSGTTARRCRPPSGTATGPGVRAVGAAGSGRVMAPVG